MKKKLCGKFNDIHYVILCTKIILQLWTYIIFTGAFIRETAFFGKGNENMPIGMKDVCCKGSEQKLTDCLYKNNYDCSHNEDATVVCNGRRF